LRIRRRNGIKQQKEKSDRRRWIVGLLVTTIVSLIAGGFLGPYASSYFASLSQSKPNIQIVKGEDTSSIIPMWGTNWVMIKVVVKNSGSSPEQNVDVRLEVQSPWNFNGSSWFIYTLSSIAGGNANMVITNCQNSAVSQLEHGTFQVTVRVYGSTQNWDTQELSQSW